MGDFTLRAFELIDPGVNLDLKEVVGAHICAPTAAAGKLWLTELILGKGIRSGYFYRFESPAVFTEVRPSFVFNISFHLFDDGRICPVRIWSREERDGSKTAGPEWTVDFNGRPGWSSIASIEPRWYRLPSTTPSRAGLGMSQKDWYKRDCWTVREPAATLGLGDAA